MALTMHKGIIFLAEDDTDVRENFEDALEDAGYLVLSARSGLEALARMRGFSNRAVAIVDLNMPDMNGIELIAQMRSEKELSNIPILAISAERKGPIEGATRFLRKPLELKELLRSVQELLPGASSPLGPFGRGSG
jgi:CheY-like chemotaxis protein